MSESTPEDVVEQRTSPTGTAAPSSTPVLPVEADPADVLEQATAAAPGEHTADRELPLEADEADAAEQAVVVELDDERDR